MRISSLKISQYFVQIILLDKYRKKKLSLEEEGTAIDLYTIKFEDYCKFARVSSVEL